VSSGAPEFDWPGFIWQRESHCSNLERARMNASLDLGSHIGVKRPLLALLLKSCVTLGKSLHLSEFHTIREKDFYIREKDLMRHSP
jgi:hypothetical protein